MLDADVIIRGERGTFNLKKWIASRPDEQFEIAAITVAELWHGVERASKLHKAARQRYVEGLVQSLPIIVYSEHTAYYHARIRAELDPSGKMIGAYDLIVAASALERNSSVASFNRRHFASVKGLRVIEPK